MLSAGPGGAWSQEASYARAAVSGCTVSDAMRPKRAKEELALRKKNERENTTALWTRLALLAPTVDENKALPGHRSKTLRGRTKDELLKDVLKDVTHAVRLARRLMGPGALEQAFTTQAGGGLVAIELKSGKIAHQSPSFQTTGGGRRLTTMGEIPWRKRGRAIDGFLCATHLPRRSPFGFRL